MRYDNGSSGDLTTVDVDGDVDGIVFAPTTGFNAGRYIKLNIADDVTESSVLVSHYTDIDIGGNVDGTIDSSEADWTIGDHGDFDVTGDFRDVDFTLGSGGASTGTRASATFGSVGSVASPANGTWTIRTHSDVTVTTDITAATTGFSVSMEGDASITVSDDTDEGTWTLNDSASVTGGDEITDGTWIMFDASEVTAPTIRRGIWKLFDDPTIVTAEFIEDGHWILLEDSMVEEVSGQNLDIEDGEWELYQTSTLNCRNIDGGTWNVQNDATINVSDDFLPVELRVEGGTVTADQIGDSAGLVWDVALNGDADVTATAYFALDGVSGNGASNSDLSYSNTRNKVDTAVFHHWGTFTKTSAAELVIRCAIMLIETEIVDVIGLATQSTVVDFDTDGIELRMKAKSPSGVSTIEPHAIDFEGDFPGSTVVFSDSPCTNRWAKLTIEEDVEAEVFGHYDSFPDMGLGESVHTIDLLVEDGATLTVGSHNIYYTGSMTNDGTIQESEGVPYTPIQAVASTFGDFDGDGDGDESADVTFFNDAFCTCDTNNDYEPLADFDCDGDVDCADRDQYDGNWSPSGLTSGCTGGCDDPCN